MHGRPNKDTAVVILSYNSRKWHERFLPLILSQAADQYDVYVVDHASPDDTSAYITQHFPQVRLLQLSENHGFAWGYARALSQISAKYYLLLSADFEVSPGWFAPLHTAMERNTSLAACQPKIRYFKDKAFFEYAGAAGGFKDRLGYLFCRGRIFESLERDEGQYDDDREIFWASGGCVILRSAAYHEVGGLDPDLYAHMEEVDLCWRLKNAGYAVGYVAGSTVFHVGGSVIRYGSPQKTYYNFRNSYVLLLKNERSAKLLWLIPFRFILDALAGLQMLFRGQYKNIWAIIRAHWSFILHFRKWYRKRKDLAGLLANRVANRQGIYQGSIILDYFLRGRKKFSELPF